MRLATPLRTALALVLALPLSAGLVRAQNAVSSDAPSLATTVSQTSIGAKTSTEQAPGGATSSFGQGGPDAFGYTWIDSDEPGGPVFVWNDISGTGTPVSLTDDSSIDVPLPFNFSFYGAVQSTLRIGSNGFVAFGGTANTFTNQPIPTAADPNNMIAGFWDDLNPGDGGTIHYQAGAGTFTVQYTNVPRFADPASTVTFQVVLNQDGTIRTYYNAMVGVTDSGTIGLENATGTVGLQVVFNAAYVHNGLAILFESLPPPVASVTPGSLTFNLSPGGSDTQQVTVANTAPPGSANLLFDATVLGNASTTLTHSSSMDVLVGSGVACGPTGDNFVYRVFDLTAMGVTEPFNVTSIDLGIEQADSGVPSTVTLYTLSGPFVVANLTQVAQASLPLTGQSLVVVNVPISATFQPTDVMVVEWAYEMSGIGTYFGGNPAPQTGPTYIRSVTCAVPEPLDLAAIGFPDSHWALTVNGAGAPPVVTATGTSGTVAPGASAQIAVTADATGLTPGTYNFSLEVETNDPANPNVSVPITVNVSSGGPNTYPSTDTPIAIPDNLPSGITSTIVIPPFGGLEVVDLDVDMNITHSWVGDIEITLTKDATTVAIFDRPGVPATVFGCSGDNIDIVMDDEGTDGSVDGSCTTGTPAYPVAGGHYTPDNALSAFDGINVPGSWVLHVADLAGGDTGTLDSWALIITEDIGTASPGNPSTEASLRVLPNPMNASGTVELTVPTSQDVRVAVYDMLGREVMVLFEGSLDATQRAMVSVAAGRLNAGSYVVRATGESFEMIQRVTVAR